MRQLDITNYFTLLDTQYFHVVFTLPQEIAAIAYQNKEVVYDILFHATMSTIAILRQQSTTAAPRTRRPF